MTSSHKNIGLNSLEKDIENRWKWLIKEDRLNKNRYSQDIEWMKNSIIREFGLVGLKKGFEKINYKKNLSQNWLESQNFKKLIFNPPWF